MLFTSPIFLYFFAAVLLFHGLLRSKTSARKVFLLFASYVFYAYWDFPSGLYLLPLLVASSLVDYWVGLKLYLTPRANTTRRRTLLLGSLVFNLGMLCTFKYLGFFATVLNDLSEVFGNGNLTAIPQIILPLGISFFTFQSMSYTIDAYRRRSRPYRSLLDFMLFVAFFPQLIAGPIVRADQFRRELHAKRDTGLRAVDHGMRIALVGFLLKVVLADNVAPQVDRIFTPGAEIMPLDALVGMYGFSLQIFCDFAGYSLIATGLAHMFGFRLPQNFNRPYLATGLRDFWRRWHITLSTWLRDYLYKPLSGSRHGLRRTMIALMLTMLLGGLWHGASWNFIIWGGCHGALLAIGRAARFLGGSKLEHWNQSRVGIVINWLLTFHVVSLLWVFFRAETLGHAVDFLGLIFSAPAQLLSSPSLHIEAWLVLPFLTLFVLYHAISCKELPEQRILRFRNLTALAVLVLGWLLVEIFYVGNISFIYFAF